jgi:hypothetical protein
MSKAILDAIKGRLYATTALTTELTSRIYYNSAPADARLPLLVYTATVRTTPFFGSITRHEVEIEFATQYDNRGGTDIYLVSDGLATAFSTPITVTGFDALRGVRIERGVPSFADDGWTMIERWRFVAHDT